MTDQTQDYVETLFKSLFAKRKEAKLRKSLVLKSLEKAAANPDIAEANEQLDVIKNMGILDSKDLLDAYAEKKLALSELQDRGVRAVVPLQSGERVLFVTPKLAK